MSAWQFKMKVLPVSTLIAHHGRIPEHVEVVHLDNSVPLAELERRSEELPDYWIEFDESEAVQTAIADLLPERESWSSLARMFGENSKDEIEVWRKADGTIARITLSFSLSSPNPVFVQNVLDFANRFNLRLLALQSEEVFEPSITGFIAQAEKCSAARFIPHGMRLCDLLG